MHRGKDAETQAQLNAGVSASVDLIQGYFLARPMDSDVAMALICQRNDERSWKLDLDAARQLDSPRVVGAKEQPGLLSPL
jgi:predicted signal transduction protein with EAL and GGDEF domain